MLLHMYLISHAGCKLHEGKRLVLIADPNELLAVEALLLL